MENKRAVGTKYEQIAGNFLENNGIRILEFNFFCKKGEIDIIGMDKNTIVFVEVKYRKNDSFGEPYASVDFRKQKKIRDIAVIYLMNKGLYEKVPCRFDCISICGEDISWIKDAF